MHTADLAQPAHQPAQPSPLGPDSLTWRYFGDLRGLLLIGRTGILQNMHPGLAAGVLQHSDLFANPWNRLLRSIPPILGVVYDGGQAAGTALQVRSFHRDIKGQDGQGRPYHALSPELFYWAHATFFEAQIALQQWLGTPLDEQQCERLYQESVHWYALYGLPMGQVPESYVAFQEYWQRMLEQRLQPTEITAWYFGSTGGLQAPYSWMRGPLWWCLQPVLVGGVRWVARGTLPPVLRERLGLRWTASDQRRLRLLAGFLRLAWRVLPGEWGYFPRARRAIRRARLAAPAEQRSPGA
ncbi:hypothetical protein PSm6_46390 [Pseudomonas solani]|uniref:ER-bound oxygenase mpaB/mpaB'/Rubber oxygenase catalytic domain-containing protein n=1 Tax=Pseudomonas solani TaxID=2731552 RepID=A0ABM7LF98_9PSED|nr:oxygenase MpaB family protein [Pseudomonas solani]MDN4147440.1 oxygenase MpaB family protein [Pseudomonas tohonis]BCD88232.1 hypothetical protein PSm6_46390 [Pseudomonas solani]